MLINGPKIGLRAEFKAVLLEDGKVVEETDWNSNMITDLCLTAIHSWSCQQRCFARAGRACYHMPVRLDLEWS